jgi:hypothetical protein
MEKNKVRIDIELSSELTDEHRKDLQAELDSMLLSFAGRTGYQNSAISAKIDQGATGVEKPAPSTHNLPEDSVIVTENSESDIYRAHAVLRYAHDELNVMGNTAESRVKSDLGRILAQHIMQDENLYRFERLEDPYSFTSRFSASVCILKKDAADKQRLLKINVSA